MDAESSYQDIKWALGAVLATSEQEQTLFYALFDAHFDQFFTSQADESQGHDEKPKLERTKRRIWPWVMSAGLAILLVSLLYWVNRPDPPPTPPRAEDNQPENLKDCSSDMDGDGLCDDVDPCPNIYDPAAELPGMDVINPCDSLDRDGDGIPNDEDPCPNFYEPAPMKDSDGDGIPDCADVCPQVPNEKEIDKDGDCVPDEIDNCKEVSNPNQEDYNGDGIGNACDHSPDDPDQDGFFADDNCPDHWNEDQSDVDLDMVGDSCDLVNDLLIGFSQPDFHVDISAFEVDCTPPPPEEVGTWWQRSGWVIVGWGIGVLLLLWVIVIGQGYQRRLLQRRRSEEATPPFRLEFNYDNSWSAMPTRLRSELIRDMRDRIKGNDWHLDIEATIRNTIAHSGFPVPLYEQQKYQPEYLVLIQRQTLRDQQARYFEAMIQDLMAQGVYLDIYYYDRDPRNCYSARTGKIVPLSTLQHTRHNYRLICIGDAESWLHPMHFELDHWTQMVEEWRHRVVLTPKNPNQWGLAEAVVSKRLLVLPAMADCSGLQLALELMEDDQLTGLEGDIPAAMADGRFSVGDEVNGQFIDSLRKYLGSSAFQLLASCAIYPELHWDLTLHIGMRLSRGMPKPQDLFRLVSLPWFREAKMPEALRTLLIQSMSKAEEHEAREIILSLLENHTAPHNSKAEEFRNMLIHAQHLILTDDSDERRAEIQRLRQVAPDVLERDGTIIELVRSRFSRRWERGMPIRLRKKLFNFGLSWFGWKPGGVLRLVMAPVIGLILLGLTIPPVPDPVLSDYHTLKLDGSCYVMEKGLFYAAKGERFLANEEMDSAFYYLFKATSPRFLGAIPEELVPFLYNDFGLAITGVSRAQYKNLLRAAIESEGWQMSIEGTEPGKESWLSNPAYDAAEQEFDKAYTQYNDLGLGDSPLYEPAFYNYIAARQRGEEGWDVAGDLLSLHDRFTSNGMEVNPEMQFKVALFMGKAFADEIAATDPTIQVPINAIEYVNIDLVGFFKEEMDVLRSIDSAYFRLGERVTNRRQAQNILEIMLAEVSKSDPEEWQRAMLQDLNRLRRWVVGANSKVPVEVYMAPGFGMTRGDVQRVIKDYTQIELTSLTEMTFDDMKEVFEPDEYEFKFGMQIGPADFDLVFYRNAVLIPQDCQNCGEFATGLASRLNVTEQQEADILGESPGGSARTDVAANKNPDEGAIKIFLFPWDGQSGGAGKPKLELTLPGWDPSDINTLKQEFRPWFSKVETDGVMGQDEGERILDAWGLDKTKNHIIIFTPDEWENQADNVQRRFEAEDWGFDFEVNKVAKQLPKDEVEVFFVRSESNLIQEAQSLLKQLERGVTFQSFDFNLSTRDMLQSRTMLTRLSKGWKQRAGLGSTNKAMIYSLGLIFEHLANRGVVFRNSITDNSDLLRMAAENGYRTEVQFFLARIYEGGNRKRDAYLLYDGLSRTSGQYGRLAKKRLGTLMVGGVDMEVTRYSMVRDYVRPGEYINYGSIRVYVDDVLPDGQIEVRVTSNVRDQNNAKIYFAETFREQERAFLNIENLRHRLVVKETGYTTRNPFVPGVKIDLERESIHTQKTTYYAPYLLEAVIDVEAHNDKETNRRYFIPKVEGGECEQVSTNGYQCFVLIDPERPEVTLRVLGQTEGSEVRFDGELRVYDKDGKSYFGEEVWCTSPCVIRPDLTE